MARAGWSISARTDLKSIVLYIAVKEGQRVVARRIAHEMRERSRFYAENPTLGQLYPEIGESIRGFVHKRWLVLYRPEADGIAVLAVVDSARDFTSFFARRPLPPDAGPAASMP
jgi:plasmid stabilization system protein ParE